MADRIGDAMRRGALSHGLHTQPDVDFMQVDWFALADQPLSTVQELFGITPKSPKAIAAGSVSPWQSGGISEAQLAGGAKLAEQLGVAYDAYGAGP